MTGQARLAGKRALVTGGSRGIGAAIARRLAADGAAVAVNYVADQASADKLVAELTGKGHQVAAFRADVSDPAQTHDLVEQVVEAMGGIDILASNAGVEYFGALESITLSDFDRVFHINVAGQLFATQAAAGGDDGRGADPAHLIDQRPHRRLPAHPVRGQQGRRLGDGAQPGARVGRTRHRHQRDRTRGHRHRHGRRSRRAYTPPALRDVPLMPSSHR